MATGTTQASTGTRNATSNQSESQKARNLSLGKSLGRTAEQASKPTAQATRQGIKQSGALAGQGIGTGIGAVGDALTGGTSGGAISQSFGKAGRQIGGQVADKTAGVAAQKGIEKTAKKAGKTAGKTADKQRGRFSPRNQLSLGKNQQANRSRLEQLEKRVREEAGKRAAQGIAIAITGGTGTGTLSTVAGYAGKKVGGSRLGRWLFWGIITAGILFGILICGMLLMAFMNIVGTLCNIPGAEFVAGIQDYFSETNYSGLCELVKIPG